LLYLHAFSAYFINGSVSAAAVHAFLLGRFALIGAVAAAAAVAADGRMSAVLEAMLTLHWICCIFAYFIC